MAFYGIDYSMGLPAPNCHLLRNPADTCRARGAQVLPLNVAPNRWLWYTWSAFWMAARIRPGGEKGMEPMPNDLTGAVHATLTHWYQGEIKPLPWGEMLIVTLRQAEQPTLALQLLVKGVLLDALSVLEQQASEQASILRLRFLDLFTAAATANRLNLTVDVVYKRQRSALEHLAAAVWEMEVQARMDRTFRVRERLEIPDPPRLFGVDGKLAELTGALTRGEGGWLTAVVGIGGIGKTSLADAAVRALEQSPVFVDIAWVSARQERFTLWDGLEEGREARPALTSEQLLQALASQFGVQEMNRLSQAEVRAALYARLKARPHLVVVDNLETAADYQVLIPELQRLSNPTRFLLTSRRRLHDHPGVLNIDLDELSAADSLALLRREARERGLTAVTSAPDEALLRVHGVAGGNPLALKLLLGQMHSLSLSQVVDDLREARGMTIDGLYRFIYLRSWQLLDHEARQVLAVMPLLAESGGGLEQIAGLCELPGEAVADALQQLIALSLVNVRGTIDMRRYNIHRLTATFLVREVLKWQAA